MPNVKQLSRENTYALLNPFGGSMRIMDVESGKALDFNDQPFNRALKEGLHMDIIVEYNGDNNQYFNCHGAPIIHIKKSWMPY